MLLPGDMLENLESFLHLLAPDRLLPHIGAMGAAYVLALPIGWNREQEARSAGLRTFPLVALASCGFVQGAERITGSDPQATARIVEGVITGIGFIGSGAILQMNDRVQGTATAASIWATGAMGTAVGVGSYDVAVALSVMTFMTLGVLTRLKKEARTD